MNNLIYLLNCVFNSAGQKYVRIYVNDKYYFIINHRPIRSYNTEIDIRFKGYFGHQNVYSINIVDSRIYCDKDWSYHLLADHNLDLRKLISRSIVEML